jgi:MFS family permease
MTAAPRRASRSTRVLIGALAGGTVGLLAGAFAIDWIDPGPPDLSMAMLIAMSVVGGMGWIVGAAFGWIGGRHRPPPSRATRWTLAAIAVAFAWFGVVSIHQAQHEWLGPMIDDLSLRDPLRARLALSIAVDTVLAVLTLLTLAVGVPARRRREEVPLRPAVTRV